MYLYAIVMFDDLKSFIDFYNARKDTRALLNSLDAHKGIVRYKRNQDEAKSKFENVMVFEGEYCVSVQLLIDEFGVSVVIDGVKDSKAIHYYV